MRSLVIGCAAVAFGALASAVGEAQTSSPAGGAAPTVREACAADAAKFCSDAEDLQSRRQCMTKHRSQLSEDCIAAYKAARAAPPDGRNDASGSVPAADVRAAPVRNGGVDSVASRIANRNFPSIFMPWNAVENLREPNGTVVPASGSETPLATRARHDLYWGGWPQMGLKLANGQQYPLLSPVFTPESTQAALRNRATMLAANPNMVILSEVHFRTAPSAYLPPDSPYWIRGGDNYKGNGKRYGNHQLDLANPELQDKVAAFCAALVRTGVYDGCMFDVWLDDATAQDSLSLIRKLRSAVGEKAILIGNVSGRLPTLTASYLNGMYMEGFGAHFFPDWRVAAANLLWGESHLHKPAITALEGWWQTTSRNDDRLMREITTLSLVFSDGYALFSDPNGPPDHLHDWYPFWDKSLGKPTGPLAALDRPDLSGAYTRQFEKGEAVFNPPSNGRVVVQFQQSRRSASTNATGRSFTVSAGDGDLFLNVE